MLLHLVGYLHRFTKMMHVHTDIKTESPLERYLDLIFDQGNIEQIQQKES